MSFLDDLKAAQSADDLKALFSGASKKGEKVVPVVKLHGIIKPGGSSPFSAAPLNIDSVRDRLTRAFNTKGAVAVALDINSPGGSPAQSELIGNLIRDLAAEKNIPVYAFAQDVAASGGYWLACAADEIYSARTSILGSIGVVSGGLGVVGLYEKLGLEERTYTAGASKRRLSMAKPEKPEDVAWLQAHLNETHEMFKDWVMERRGKRLVVPNEKQRKAYLDNKVFTGDIWSGDAAVKIGLIDGIGDMQRVITEKFSPKAKLVEVEDKKGGLISSFLKAFGGSAPATAGIGAEQIGAGIVHAAVDVAEDKAMWDRFTMR